MLKSSDQHAVIAAFGFPPREVTRTGGIPVPLRVALFLLIPHVWVGMFLIGSVLREPAMELWGRDTTAVVVSRDLVRGKGTRCQIVYAYNDGVERRTETETFGEQDFAAYPPGKQLQVRALRLGPIHQCQMLDRQRGVGICCMLPFALVWNGFMASLLYTVCLSPLSNRRLIRIGQPVIGKIVGKAEQKGKGTTYMVTYTYVPTDGRERLGRMTVSNSQYQTAQAGENVIVFYEPRRSSNSTIYRFCNYAARDRYGYKILE